MVTIEAQVLFVNQFLHQAITSIIKIQLALINNNRNILLSQPQLQQGQPLYSPNQVISCLNHVLVDSVVKAGTTPNFDTSQ
jgi:hypothetical protein